MGANTEEGLGRCLNSEDFYLRMVGMGLADGGFDSLKAAVDSGDLDTAFEAAHALKGVMANLSLTPISEKVSEITELLRARTQMDYAPLVEAILAEKEKFAALL